MVKALFLVLTASAAAVIPPPNLRGPGDVWNGEYYSSKTGVVITIRPHRDGIHSIQFEAGVTGKDCGGGYIFRERLPASRTVTLMADREVDDDSGLMCKMKLSRDGRGGLVAEEDGCGYHHGAACGFGGNFVKSTNR